MSTLEELSLMEDRAARDSRGNTGPALLSPGCSVLPGHRGGHSELEGEGTLVQEPPGTGV